MATSFCGAEGTPPARFICKLSVGERPVLDGASGSLRHRLCSICAITQLSDDPLSSKTRREGGLEKPILFQRSTFSFAPGAPATRMCDTYAVFYVLSPPHAASQPEETERTPPEKQVSCLDTTS